MALGLAFWIIMLVWLIFGAWSGYNAGQPYSWRQSGGGFILLLILGWKVFGPPIQ